MFSVSNSAGVFQSAMGNQAKYECDGYWYKVDFLGYEGAAEYLASYVMQYTDLNESEFVKYDLVEIEQNGKMVTGCVSKDFKAPDESVVTIAQLLKSVDRDYYNSISLNAWQQSATTDKIQSFVSVVEQNTGIKDFGVYLSKLLDVDYLTLNEDRHFNNIALLYNRKQDKFRPAPIFDCGMGFLSNLRTKYSEDGNVRKELNSVKARPFATSFEKQVLACHHLYGSCVSLQTDFTPAPALQRIKEVYGDIIASRIRAIVLIHFPRVSSLLSQPK